MAITIASNNRNFLKDNNPFFYLGDTCWSAFTNITDNDWEYYLQYRKRQGFNTLQINILPQWDASKTNLNFQPFNLKEDNKSFDFANINDAYFERALNMCERAKYYGFELALVVLWCNYVPETWANNFQKYNTIPKEYIKIYVEKVHNTFTKLNPIYVISGDTDLKNDVSKEYYLIASDILRKLAPSCLQSFHIMGRMDTLPKEFVERCDFYMYQSGHNAEIHNLDTPYRLAEKFYNDFPAKPIINSEPCYEQMGFSRNMYGRFHINDIRRAAWQSVLSGAFAGITYGAAGIYNWYDSAFDYSESKIGEGFDKPNPWQMALHYKGAWDYGDLKHFFEKYSIDELIPCQEIILNESQDIRASYASDYSKLFIYLPHNTNIKLKIDKKIISVKILDLESRHIEIGSCSTKDKISTVRMHCFNGDVVYILELK